MGASVVQISYNILALTVRPSTPNTRGRYNQKAVFSVRDFNYNYLAFWLSSAYNRSICFSGDFMKKQTTVLLILDGWGYREENKDNAINNANKPNWDSIWQHSTHTLINASGLMVGLPQGQMGNSEVGHINIGSGRIVYQELTRIDEAIKDKSFFDNKVLTNAVDQAVKGDKAVHILGLLSPGGVHSHEDHIIAMIKLAAERGAKKVFVHAFLDGRDMPPRSAESSLQKVDALLSKLGVGYIASVSGRYYAMDRDNRWDRVEKAYDAMTIAKAEYTADSAEEALNMAYARNENDEFVKPTIIKKHNQAVTIADGDSVIFMNFRSDRARQLSHVFTDSEFSGFKRQVFPKVHFVTLTKYADDIKAHVAYAPEKLTNILGQVLADQHMTQLRIAETEKYAHVTFFFNGGQEAPFGGEDRILVPSPKVATYDLQPEMNAYEVTDKLVDAITAQKYDVIICNYANSDMVGHTGNYDAAVKAIEALDICIGRVADAVHTINGNLFITADHGNADQMVDPETGKMHTAHTTNPVPFIYQGNKKASVALSDGKLSDIAPTILAVIGVKQPKEMTGKSILKFD
ncbi:2,3-bisphosphoglycerate-independent phosphoglycerate mutase [Cysteiniphilum litorale]|uniref:2,3-bisphosphoglycerate-independent phosphoglycerate mutase n=2 Tax=Fastidiosibacteraceae TaxID=2056687 RepID=A0A8J3E933_9GAMM|nr:2,3-bisphosphoglycerate-independent phosphoglycerate mutase [Cysteiniphilum litorale]